MAAKVVGYDCNPFVLAVETRLKTLNAHIIDCKALGSQRGETHQSTSELYLAMTVDFKPRYLSFLCFIGYLVEYVKGEQPFSSDTNKEKKIRIKLGLECFKRVF